MKILRYGLFTFVAFMALNFVTPNTVIASGSYGGNSHAKKRPLTPQERRNQQARAQTQYKANNAAKKKAQERNNLR